MRWDLYGRRAVALRRGVEGEADGGVELIYDPDVARMIAATGGSALIADLAEITSLEP